MEKIAHQQQASASERRIPGEVPEAWGMEGIARRFGKGSTGIIQRNPLPGLPGLSGQPRGPGIGLNGEVDPSGRYTPWGYPYRALGPSTLQLNLPAPLPMQPQPFTSFRQPPQPHLRLGPPFPVNLPEMQNEMRSRFSVPEVRAGTREEQADQHVRDNFLARNTSWQAVAMPQSSMHYDAILAGFAYFEAAFGFTPLVEKVLLFRTHFSVQADGSYLAETGTRGQFLNRVLSLYIETPLPSYSTPSERSTSRAPYSRDIPGELESWARVVTHELGHGIDDSVTHGCQQLPQHAFSTLQQAFALAVGWHNPTSSLYDIQVPGVQEAVRTGTGLDRFTPIREATWDHANWLEQPVSAYSLSGASEDFAETAMMYARNPEGLRLRSPARYQFMDVHRQGWATCIGETRTRERNQQMVQSANRPIGPF